MARRSATTILRRGQATKRAASEVFTNDDAPRKAPKIFREEVSVGYEIPEEATFTLSKRREGHNVLSGTTVVTEMPWDLDFQTITGKLDEIADTRADTDRAPGTWERSRLIRVFEKTKRGIPDVRFSIEMDWKLMKKEYQYLAKSSNKQFEFRVLYVFRAAELDHPNLKDQRSVSEKRKISSALDKIRLANECKKCGHEWCYIPLPGEIHCALTPKSRVEWAETILAGTTNAYRPPENLPELVQWRKDFRRSCALSWASERES